MTKAETILWIALKGRAVCGQKFRRQHAIREYVVDFACVAAKLAIEVDGATHTSDAQHRHDERRTFALEQDGWAVLRVTNLDIYQDLDGVVRGIEAALSPLVPSGHSPRKRGETPFSVTPVSSPACGGGGPEGSGGGKRE